MTGKEYIYVFRDRLDNNLIKVGFSKNPINRLRQLYTTATALPLQPYCIWRVNDMRLAEKAAHEVLRDHRINERREFFEIAPSKDFSLCERTDYDMSCVFLDKLLELIEEGMGYVNVHYQRIFSLDELE